VIIAGLNPTRGNET